MLALGHDFTIALNGDAAAGMTELVDQPGSAQAGRNLAGFAVEGNRDHGRAIWGRWVGILSSLGAGALQALDADNGFQASQRLHDAGEVAAVFHLHSEGDIGVAIAL